MKKQLFAILLLLTSCQFLLAQNTFTANFETFDSTPYYFRFGNNTSSTYYPRWKYSHDVVDNPFLNNTNPSAKVLRYTSLEARWYGLKFKFPAPLNLDDIDTLSFDIYQPASIVGQPVNTTYSSTVATTQEIRVKLLTYFNTTQDSREDAGVVLTFTGAVLPFATTGQWIHYQAVINPSKFAIADQNKLATGVLGLAIMPTYNTGVTLQNDYVCYIDNIQTRPTSYTAVESVSDCSKWQVNYTQGVVRVKSDFEGQAIVKVYDMKGNVVADLLKGKFEGGEHSFSVALPNGMYFVSIYTNGRYHNFKINA